MSASQPGPSSRPHSPATSTPTTPIATTPQPQPPRSSESYGETPRRSASPSPGHEKAGHSDAQQAAKENEWLVAFDHLDPHDPRNLSFRRKWLILSVCFLIEAWANTISSMAAPAIPGIAADLDVSLQKARIVQAVYLYGFAAGAVILTPLSEDYGRRRALLPSVLLLALLQIPCALTPSYGLLVTARLLAGFFASVTFTSVGVINDLFPPQEQGWGVNMFALSAEVGAVIGPIAGGYLFVAHGWRWTFGVMGIVTAGLLAIYYVLVPETRSGIILAARAAAKRKETSEKTWYAAHEREREGHTPRALLQECVVRPVYMLFTEPIVFWFALFDGFNYAIVYLFLEAFSLVYAQYGFGTGAAGLPFIAVLVGFFIAFFAYPLQMAYEARDARKQGGEATPEARLAWSVPGGIIFPISLFWFAWTSQPSVHWIVPTLAGGLFGISSHIIFIAVSDYTIAAYGPFAASAVGAQSLLREILSGSVTLVADPLYHNLGPQYASTLLACIAVVLAAVPPVLYWYGPRIRARSSFAQQIAEAERKRAVEAERVKDVWERRETGEA